jgi:hypothetical protein
LKKRDNQPPAVAFSGSGRRRRETEARKGESI